MSGHEVHNAPPEVLSLAWRKERIFLGDIAMVEADKAGVKGDREGVKLHLMVAQAHYTAANVRGSEPRQREVAFNRPVGGRVEGTVVIGGEPPNPVPLRDRINTSDGIHDRPRRPGA